MPQYMEKRALRVRLDFSTVERRMKDTAFFRALFFYGDKMEKYGISKTISGGFAILLGCALLIGACGLYTFYMMKQKVDVRNALDQVIDIGGKAREASQYWLVHRESLSRRIKGDGGRSATPDHGNDVSISTVKEMDSKDGKNASMTGHVPSEEGDGGSEDPLSRYTELKEQLKSESGKLVESKLSKEETASLNRIMEAFYTYDRSFENFQDEFFKGVALMDRLREQAISILGQALSLEKAVDRKGKGIRNRLDALKKKVEGGISLSSGEDEIKHLLALHQERDEITRQVALTTILTKRPLAFQEMAKNFVLYQDDVSGSGLILEMEQLIGIDKDGTMGISFPRMQAAFVFGREAKLFDRITGEIRIYYETFKEYYRLNFSMRRSLEGMDEERKKLNSVIGEVRAAMTSDFASFQRYASLFLIGLILLALIIGVTAAIRIAGNIVPPIEILSTLAKRFALGNVRIDKDEQGHIESICKRGDELGDMGRAFERLAVHFFEQSKVAALIADGDLRIQVMKASDEDIMGDAFHKIVDRLGILFGEVKASARKVKEDTVRINEANQKLSQWSNTQAASLQSLNEIMDSISSKTHENAKSADDANSISMRASGLANEGKTEMKGMVGAMADIDRSSREVSKVVAVIRGIADQTRRLALNATIEAARAGDRGRGFAVVAEEIRRLATLSAESVDESSRLVNETLKRVETGNQSVINASGALDRIVEVIHDISRQMERIKSASSRQIDEIERTLTNLESVDNMVQNTASSAEETAQISGFLTEQAIQLENSLGMFKLVRHGEGGEEDVYCQEA